MPVGGQPILWHIMKYYAHYGHSSFVLCLGYKGELIADFFMNYSSRTRDSTVDLGTGRVAYHNTHGEANWSVTLANTGLDALTGARVRRIKRYVDDEEHFFLTYGDCVSTVDLNKLLQFHRDHGRILTVTGVRPPSRFGEIAHDNGRVVEFNEKPQAIAGLISGGFFVCRRDVFDYLDDREDLIFERDPINRLVRDSQMMVYEHDDFWHPMDTPRDYRLLNELCLNGDAPWIVW